MCMLHGLSRLVMIDDRVGYLWITSLLNTNYNRLECNQVEMSLIDSNKRDYRSTQCRSRKMPFEYKFNLGLVFRALTGIEHVISQFPLNEINQLDLTVINGLCANHWAYQIGICN